jgi:hypothetical protein
MLDIRASSSPLEVLSTLSDLREGVSCAPHTTAAAARSLLAARRRMQRAATPGVTAVSVVVVSFTTACLGHRELSTPPPPLACTTTGPCTPPSATDGRKDADETDVDCGGTPTPRCADGLMCVIDANCLSNFCFAGICAAAPVEEAGAPPEPTPQPAPFTNPGCNAPHPDPTLCPQSVPQSAPQSIDESDDTPSGP